MIGKRSAHRINTGRRDIHKLRWKKLKHELGYGKIVDEDCEWQNTLQGKKHSSIVSKEKRQAKRMDVSLMMRRS